MSAAIPMVLLFTFVYAFVKKVNAYNAFIDGAKEAVPLALSLFPYIAAMIMAVELMRASGFYNLLSLAFSPLLKLLGIPSELTQLVLLRPFSGSGSLALVNEIFLKYGVDGYIGRCAAVIFGSSETVFYLTTIYFSDTKIKKLGLALPIALFCCLLSAVLACLMCRFF